MRLFVVAGYYLQLCSSLLIGPVPFLQVNVLSEEFSKELIEVGSVETTLFSLCGRMCVCVCMCVCACVYVHVLCLCWYMYMCMCVCVQVMDEVMANPHAKSAVLISGKPDCFIAGADIR